MEAYQRLEVEFATWAGLDPEGMVAVNSGTSALHLAFESLRLPPGSGVIVPDFAMISCARAVSLAGLTPVFVDCREDLLIDPALAARAASVAHCRALLAVHTYGRRCDMDALHRLAGRHGLAVVEDLAEAHGVRPHPESTAACYSFFKNKVISGEEGGAVWFRDSRHARLARQLRCVGFTDAHDFTHLPRGMNYRLANSLAALILDSLSKVEANLAERRRIEGWYDALCPDAWRMPPRDVPWVMDIRIPGMTREKQGAAVAGLRAAGVEARHGFKPLSRQEEYVNCQVVKGGVADRASREVIYLPLKPGAVTKESAAQAFGWLQALID